MRILYDIWRTASPKAKQDTVIFVVGMMIFNIVLALIVAIIAPDF
jgi:hypothetical protein